jgi:hypothetical protein
VTSPPVISPRCLSFEITWFIGIAAGCHPELVEGRAKAKPLMVSQARHDKCYERDKQKRTVIQPSFSILMLINA